MAYSKVAIITDSISCLPKEIIEQYGIKIISPNIYFDGKVYRDWVDITPSEAYQLLEKAPDLFSTSAPPPNDFKEAYLSLSTEAESILCITLSSKMSTLYNVALTAKEQVKSELPHTNIEVLDSQTATGAEGFIVLAAAKAAEEGKDITEVIQAAQKMIGETNVIFILDTIRHAYRTGRIPKVAARLGAWLNVKPFLTIRGGSVHFTGMTRSKKKGVHNLLEVMRKKVGDEPVQVMVHHANAYDDGERLKQRVQGEFDCTEIWLTEFSPIMGYSTGKGALGLAFYADNKT